MDERIHRLIDAIFEDHQDSCIDCDTCCQKLNFLAELVSKGANVGELLPAVQAHLACCSDCREEYQALTCIMQAELNGRTTDLKYRVQKDA